MRSGRRPVLTVRTLHLCPQPDLCYEWFCAVAASPLNYEVIASEYAHFFVAVAQAIHSIGNPHIKVSTAALSPGAATVCGCCGSANCPGDKGGACKLLLAPGPSHYVTTPYSRLYGPTGITGLTFMDAMKAAVPDVFDHIDFLASHAYPASGIGYGFNAPLSQAMPGLLYFEMELARVNRSVQVGHWCSSATTRTEHEIHTVCTRRCS